MSAAMDTVRTADGIELAAIRQGEGTGLPVLFSNSLGSDHTMWDDVVAGLSDRPAIRYDTRGHGGSQAPQGPYDQAMLGRDALAVLDHYGIDRAIVCGLSLGGLAAGWLAGNARDRIAGAVFANTARLFRPESMWRDRAAQARAGGMVQFLEPTLERWFTEGFRTERPDVMDRVRAMVGAVPPEGYAACCEALAVSDMTAELRAAECPALVIAGTQDPSTTQEHGQDIVDHLRHGELATIDAAHLSAIERPEAFRDLLQTFARRCEQ